MSGRDPLPVRVDLVGTGTQSITPMNVDWLGIVSSCSYRRQVHSGIGRAELPPELPP